jgi:hypothetical protein
MVNSLYLSKEISSSDQDALDAPLVAEKMPLACLQWQLQQWNCDPMPLSFPEAVYRDKPSLCNNVYLADVGTHTPHGQAQQAQSPMHERVCLVHSSLLRESVLPVKWKLMLELWLLVSPLKRDLHVLATWPPSGRALCVLGC